MRRTSSCGVSLLVIFSALSDIALLPKSGFTFEPRLSKILHMMSTSLRSGASYITHSSSESNEAAIIGNTAFFDPLIVTSPLSGPLFSTKNFAKSILLKSLIISTSHLYHDKNISKYIIIYRFCRKFFGKSLVF